MFSVVNKNNHDDMDHSMSNPSLDAIATTASVAIPHNEFNDMQKNDDDDDDEMDSSSTSSSLSSSSTFVDNPCWGSPTECSLTYLLKQIKQEECILYESKDYIALNKPADLRMDGDYPATVHKLLTYWYPPPSVLSEFELYQKQLQVQKQQLQEGKDYDTVESKDKNNNINNNVEPVFVPHTKMNKDNDDHHRQDDDDNHHQDDDDHDNDMLLFSRFIETRYHKHSDHIDNELRPCHQLDYATSGVLLVARSRKSANYARQLLQGRNVQKVYLARIHGCLKVPSTSLSSSSTYNTNPDTRVVMGSNGSSGDGNGHKEWPMFSSLGHVQRLWKKMEVSHRRQRQRYHKGDTFKGYLPPSSLFEHWKAQERRREQQHKQQIIRKEEEEAATTMNQPTIDDTTMEVQQQQQQQDDDEDEQQQQPSKKKKARYNNQQESSSSKSLFNPRLSHEQWTHVWDQLYKTSKKGNNKGNNDMRKKEEEDDKCRRRRHMDEDNDEVDEDVDTDNDTFLVTTDMKWKQVKQLGQAHHFQRAADVYNQYLRQHQVLLQQQEKEEGFETEENNDNNNRADLSSIASTSSTGLPLLFRIQSDKSNNNNNHDNDNSTKQQQQQEKKDDGNEMDGNNNHNKNNDIQQLLKPNENTFFICASIAEIPNQFAMTLHPEETKSLLKPYSHLLPLYTLKKKKKKTKKKILQQEQQQKQQKQNNKKQKAKNKKDNNNVVVVVDDDDDDDESQPLGVPLLAREEKEEEEELLYKPCLTQCTIMEYNPQNATTKVLLIPWSGRRHQLRIHMALLGHGIVGDPTYRRKKRNRNFPRMYLHAYRLFVPSSSLLNKKNNNKNQKYNKNNKNTTNYNNKYDDNNNKNKNEKKKESIMGSNIEEEDPWQTLDLQAPDPFV